MRKVMEELREGFGLSNKHIAILDVLYDAALTAEKIAQKTKIPLGRIYGFLNELVSYNLIDKTTKKPCVYAINNPPDKIMSFLKYRYDNFIEKQAKIFDLLEQRSESEKIEVVNSGEEYAFKVIRLLSESKYIKTIVRHGSLPFILYPMDSKEFQKARKAIVDNRETLAHTAHQMTFWIYRSFNDAFNRGTKFKVIMEQKSLDKNLGIIKKVLGTEFLNKMISDAKEKLKAPNVECYVVKGRLPMMIYITPDKVFLSVLHLGLANGVMIKSSSVVDLYNDYFNDILKSAKPLSTYLRKI